MGPVVVGADEFADRAVETSEVQQGRWCSAARSEVARERGQEFGVDGSEEPFDLPSALGPADGRVNNPEVQGECGLLEVVADRMIGWPDGGSAGQLAGWLLGWPAGMRPGSRAES